MKKIWIVIGIIVVGIGGYAIYGFLTPTKATTKTEAQQSLLWQTGEWERTTDDYPATFYIKEADDKSFDFVLKVITEDATKGMKGNAKVTGNKAKWKDPDSACSLNFALENELVTIDQSKECLHQSNPNIFFTGEFKVASKTAETTEVKELSSEEAKQIISDLLAGIQDTFDTSRDSKESNEYDENDDYTPLLPMLEPYTSSSFRQGYLKDRAAVFYCQCDEPALPYSNLDARFILDNQDTTHFSASSIVFYDPVGEIGSHVQYDVVKENNEWVLDDILTTSYEKKSLNLTKEEILLHFDNVDKDIEETEYNGRKLYILHFTNDDEYIGVYADSSEMIDVPNELLPKEAQVVAPEPQVEQKTEVKPETKSEEKPQTKPETKPEMKPEEKPQTNPSALTSEQAEELVRLYLELPVDTNLSIVHDHDNDSGNFIVHVYEYVDPGTDQAHNATFGWYRVDRITHEVVNDMLDFQP